MRRGRVDVGVGVDVGVKAGRRRTDEVTELRGNENGVSCKLPSLDAL